MYHFKSSRQLQALFRHLSSQRQRSAAVAMVDLDDARDALVESGEVVEKQAKRFWNGFLDFALQDNVLEVAVGLM